MGAVRVMASGWRCAKLRDGQRPGKRARSQCFSVGFLSSEQLLKSLQRVFSVYFRPGDDAFVDKPQT